MPSVSKAVYTDLFSIGGSTTDGTTKMSTYKVAQIENLETQNRKLLGVSGQLSVQGSVPGAVLFALHVAPEIDALPDVSDYDPFAEGPTGGAGAYTGRPRPRPFGRRTFVVGAGQTNDVEIINHEYRSRSPRLIHPGDRLWYVTWFRRFGSSNTDISVRGVLRATVAG